MKNRFLLSLIIIVLLGAAVLATTFHFYTKRASVSGQFKEKTLQNDLMLWESLSSHLLSLK